MKKILSLASLLLFTAAMLLGVGCADKEVTEEIVSGAAISGFVGIWICMAVVGGLIALFLFVVWIIALVDCARRKPDEFPAGAGGENAKTIWLVILIATFFVTQLNGVAAIVYYFMVMKKMPRKK
jgi:phosphate/sulfate permease